MHPRLKTTEQLAEAVNYGLADPGNPEKVSLLITREKFPSLKAESGIEIRPLLKLL